VNKPVALLRLVSAAVLSLPLLVQAAGLGQLSVQSFLGQPLKAEIEIVSLQAGEESSIEARLASGNAFAQAGIEFNPALSTTRFEITKHDGRPVIRVTTRQPVNEPFVDMLVELRWATGLFVREYTVLLDPPGYEGPKAQPMASAPAAAPMTSPAAPTAPVMAASKAAPTAPSPAPALEAAAPSAEKPMQPAPEAASRPAPTEEKAPAATGTTGAQSYEVKKGDTLGEIALKYRPQGVTFHQMLIALQRANEDAFIRDNINLVRAGRILNLPDADSAAAVDVADANRLVIAQNADFAEYRSRLAATVAAAPAAAQAAERSAAGQITAPSQEPKAAAPKDQLKLSKADASKPGAPAAKAAREDDLAARQRATQEAQSRVTELEKNVADLQKLLQMRSQQLAQLEQKATLKPAPLAAPKVSEAPTPAVPQPQAMAPAPAAQLPAAETPTPAAAQAPAPAAAPAPPAVAPKPKPTPRPVIAPPPPEPSLVDEFLDNPIALAGLAGVIVLLGGYGAWAWKRKKKFVSKFQDSVMDAASVAPAPSGAQAGAPAAGPASVSQGSVSQAGVGGMDADDVDPIAEADVYMAYGRDAQAEEILKESLQKDPNRVAVMAKLLEIYANRRDGPSFEQVALKLKGATRGAGADWDKAAALGRSIDPGNGLYGGVVGAAPAAFAAAVAPAAAAAPSVDFDIGGGGAGTEPAAEASLALDLDLGGASASAQARSDFSPSGTLIIDSQETRAASSGLDFDLGGGSDRPADSSVGLNFELPGSASAPAEPSAPVATASSAGGGLDFDLNLGGGEATAVEPSSPSIDLSSISLDLGTPGDAPAAAGGAEADPKWQEVATKLDLAKAYEEMGDKDGARELLNEVAREGDSAQQGQAQQLLAKLG
jgi:pilus assembly protein FimV